METITADRVRELFIYDEVSGILTRRITTGNRSIAGAAAGSLSKALGYLSVGMGGKLYYVHRVIVLYMTGEWPADEVDHINGIRTDNRWANLRQVTVSINRQNRNTVRSDKKRGVLVGTKHHSRKGRKRSWQARITKDGVAHSLGYFYTESDAHNAYLNARKSLSAGAI